MVKSSIALRSVSNISSADACQRLLLLAKAKTPILDSTYGNGLFWAGCEWPIIGMDVEPTRAKNLVGSFLCLPFLAGAFPTVVFDPPFHPFVGSAEQTRFSACGGNEKELKTQFIAGLRECWRVTQRHLLVKCQGFVHNHAPQWMPLWATGCLGDPFEWLIVWREAKRVSGRWVSTNSLRRNHADYLLFDKRGNKR